MLDLSLLRGLSHPDPRETLFREPGSHIYMHSLKSTSAANQMRVVPFLRGHYRCSAVTDKMMTLGGGRLALLLEKKTHRIVDLGGRVMGRRGRSANICTPLLTVELPFFAAQFLE